MKISIFLITFFHFFNVLVAQDSMEKTMEQRAREMHRVIGLSDNKQWKKFISENYSNTLIERPMTSKVETSDKEGEKSGSSSGSVTGTEEKAKMFWQLHDEPPLCHRA